MQIAQFFMEATADQVTESKTEAMNHRIEMLQLLVECYKVHHGVTSIMVTSTLKQLSEHYRLIKEERKMHEIIESLEGFTADSITQRSGSRQIDESLLIHLHGHKDTATTEAGITLELDRAEADELITWSFDLKALQAKAERQMTQGQVSDPERTYVSLWHQASEEYRLNNSTEYKISMVQAVLAYAKFLRGQKKDNEAASILAGFWEEYEHTASSAEPLVSHFLELAQVMKSTGLSVLALEVFKHCAQSTSSQSATHKEVEKYIQSTSREVMRLSSTKSLVTESTLKEMVYSASTIDQISTTATTSLVELYLSQHRWHDATGVLKRVLRSVWPAMFAPSLEEVVLPSDHVKYCVELAGRLADCYRFRRCLIKEEDVRTRLYRAVRRDRPACGDQVLERATVDLLRLYERTSQSDNIITIHQDILDDYNKRFGGEHPTVIQKLWTLSELTRPRPIAVDYYRQIVHFLNKDSDSCHPDAFEPLLIVATELLKQDRYAEALEPCRVLFTTLQSPKMNQKLGDPAFVQSLYERYVQCLRVAHSDATIIHDVTVQYRKSCISLFGASASITIQATKALANICQASKQYETEAVQLYEELLQTDSSEIEIDHQDIRTTLDAIYDQQSASLTASKVEQMSIKDLQKVVSIRTQRLASIRSSYGWAHEEALSQMEQIVSIYTKQEKTQEAASMLQEATAQVLSTETSSVKLTASAKSIAAGYIAAGQIHKARELSDEIYRQIITKDISNASDIGFGQNTNRRLGLVFLAQLEYSLRESDVSITLNEIYAALKTEYLYFEQFWTILSSKTARLQDTTATVAFLHAFLLRHSRRSAATQVVDQYTSLFLATEGSSLGIDRNQAKIFIETVLDYFGTHASRDFVRSLAITTYNRVAQLLDSEDYQSACYLALAAMKYISAHHGYSAQAILKLVFKLGLLIAGREMDVHPAVSVKKDMLSVSAMILRDTLQYFQDNNVELAQLDLANINSLIKVLDEQHDYHTLSWVLTSLWNNRDAYALSQPQHAYTLALGRMLVITRYLTEDYTASIRLAEDLVYNCARVHGPRHPSTVEITVLLSQMYTSVAQGYQSQKGRRELAYRYYRKAATLHENALRVFVDPSSGSASDVDMEAISGMSSPSSASSPGENAEEGKHVRQHLHMLKLAVERLGDWPKEYSEYERLNNDLFNTFANDLEGVDGVDKWNLQSFGSGQAEASDDLFSFHREHRAIAV
jgi:tetratricopeptide (TPR) repeat protein